MKLCFLVDARSTIARNWIKHFISREHDVHVISSHSCSSTVLEGGQLHQVPIAFGGIERIDHGVASTLRRLDRLTKGVLRSWFTPIDLLPHVRRIRRLCNEIAPDLVHAMRIPYEGIMAALSVRSAPLLLSCWGNDFTLFTSSASDRFLTRMAMRRADALHCDCEKDVRLAREWEFSPAKPSIVLPGAGGVDTSVFHPGEPRLNGLRLEVPEAARVVINPRGMRMYVRNDIFFNAVPLILREEPRAFFLCPGMRHEPAAEKAVRDLGLKDSVRLLPTVGRAELAELFRLAEVSVSPSTHDGTPNTLLEAMASGCLPVAGDIESVREWIEPGVNGLLSDLSSPAELADAIIRGLRDRELRGRAMVHNGLLINRRAEYKRVMAQAEKFYREIIDRMQANAGRFQKAIQ